jgi:hypothetical protein
MPAKKYEPSSSEKSEANRIREEDDLNFPNWDSLPATAGLTKTEAFQLGIHHALLLLPMAMKQPDFNNPPRNPERFRL